MQHQAQAAAHKASSASQLKRAQLSCLQERLLHCIGQRLASSIRCRPLTAAADKASSAFQL